MVEYNIEVKYITYSLLEFYNTFNGGPNPLYHDEKFARVLFTSFIGTGKIAKFMKLNAEDKTILLMKG